MISGFGNRLKERRESCGATIEEISEATNIDASYFEALERGDLEKLPGPAYGKFYIRIYGEYLDFDPDPLIAEYDLELAALDPDVIGEEEAAPEHEWKEALRKSREAAAVKREEALQAEAEAEAEEEVEAEPISEEPESEPVPEPPVEIEAEEPALILPAEPEPRSERPEYPRPLWKAIAAAIVATTFLSIIIWSFMYCTEGRSPLDSRQGPEMPVAAAELQKPAAEEPESAEAEPVSEPPPSHEPQAAPGRLSVTEFGIGRRVVNYRLEGIDDRFTEGEVVWFLTRVQGGEPGDSIRHYWFRDGGRIQIVDLELGSSHYRTRSKKTLWGIGDWVVEARDSEGRILARSEFRCLPR